MPLAIHPHLLGRHRHRANNFSLRSGAVLWNMKSHCQKDLTQQMLQEMELVFEASSSDGGARQTEPEKHPSDVTISVNGVEIDTIRIPDSPADARGVLSYIHGEPGIYGYLHNIKFEASRVLKGASDTLTVRYEVKADAEAKGGFALYGARMGRYPTGPHLLIQLPIT